MRWEPVVYCFSFGTLMASIITTAFSPFCRKRQVPAKRIKVNPVHDEKRVPLPEKRATPEARLGSAIRQWSSERADSDLSYVATPAPLPPPRPVAVPEPAPQPVFEDAAAEAPAADFVYQSEAAPDPEPAPREADRQAEDPPEAEESKTVSEANPFLSYDFHGAPNFYEILQISPRADLDTIHRVYRIMAARFHPDNPVSGDHEMFLKLCEAYEVLSRPERRALYDFALQAREKEPIPLFGARIFVDGLDGELHRRFGILALLYQRRRTNQVIQGISTLELESRMSLPREHLEFTLWYLRQKGYVQIVEDNSDYTITAAGVDYVEANSARNPVLRELLTSGAPVKQAPVQTENARMGFRRRELRRGRRQGGSIILG